MMAMPPSSPRLPSPPPPTEIQIGPKSPMVSSSPETEPIIEQSTFDANSKRRIHPGTKAADMAAGPPMIALSELDSAFQLQEHLKALHYHYSKSPEGDFTIPISRETAGLIATQPVGVDRALWLYELCRFLINKCNDLIIGFLFDDPPCSATTCPEMRASEWQFLCAVHESPKSCCAIDYCCHTLDWATNIVTSQKIFPSRLSLGAGDAVDDRGAGVKHLTNIFRRLHRIFAHAWFQHKGVFWQVEGQTGLYVLFKTVCDTYDLLPAENYKLPPEAEGLEPAEDPRPLSMSILKPSAANPLTSEEDLMGSGRTNTRRHIRQSPSVGSAVTTVLEIDEEETYIAQKLKGMQISEDFGEIAEIPVIVEPREIEQKRDIQEAKPEKDSFNHNTDRGDEAPINTDSAVLETPVPTLVESNHELELEEPEEKATDPETEPEAIGHHLVMESPSEAMEADAKLEDLERFSPELLKTEPEPDMADIPPVEMDLQHAGNNKEIEEVEVVKAKVPAAKVHVVNSDESEKVKEIENENENENENEIQKDEVEESKDA